MALTNAEKQARFRKRREERLERLEAAALRLLASVSHGTERTYTCHGSTNHLPDDLPAALDALADRFRGKRLIVAGPRRGRKDDQAEAECQT